MRCGESPLEAGFAHADVPRQEPLLQPALDDGEPTPGRDQRGQPVEPSLLVGQVVHDEGGEHEIRPRDCVQQLVAGCVGANGLHLDERPGSRSDLRGCGVEQLGNRVDQHHRAAGAGQGVDESHAHPASAGAHVDDHPGLRPYEPPSQCTAPPATTASASRSRCNQVVQSIPSCVCPATGATLPVVSYRLRWARVGTCDSASSRQRFVGSPGR